MQMSNGYTCDCNKMHQMLNLSNKSVNFKENHEMGSSLCPIFDPTLLDPCYTHHVVYVTSDHCHVYIQPLLMNEGDLQDQYEDIQAIDGTSHMLPVFGKNTVFISADACAIMLFVINPRQTLEQFTPDAVASLVKKDCPDCYREQHKLHCKIVGAATL